MGERIQLLGRRGRFWGGVHFRIHFQIRPGCPHFVFAPLEAEAAEFVLVCVRLRVIHVSSERSSGNSVPCCFIGPDAAECPHWTGSMELGADGGWGRAQVFNMLLPQLLAVSDFSSPALITQLICWRATLRGIILAG